VRNFFIIQAARELHLVFPSDMATAITIRNMHLASQGTAAAVTRIKALAYSFAYSFVAVTVSQFAIGILWVGLSAVESIVDNLGLAHIHVDLRRDWQSHGLGF
jgi:cystathionine beta-lyase/cystathionine gamma-synthase